MNLFLVLDFAWKFLFFVSIFSTFYFVAVSFLPKLFKFLSASKKMNAIKISKVFLVFSFVVVSAYLTVSDRDLVIDCFGHFASKEGVFGVTRMISLVWLAGFSLFLLKDIFSYVLIIKKLNRSIVCQKSFVVTGQTSKNIHYYEVDSSIEPVVAGFFLPQIYIPQSVSMDAQVLKQILSHEYIHFKNKDSLWSFVALVIHRLNWPNPLSYLAMHSMKTNLEMATDEQAISEFNLDVVAYAKSLVCLISNANRQNVLVMNVSGSFLQIQSRLINLKNVQSSLIKNRSIYAWVMFFVLGAGLAQAFVSIRPEPQSAYQAQMCFQVKHELIIESWMRTEKSETNRCE